MNHKEILGSINVANASVLGAGEHRVSIATVAELTDRRDLQGNVIEGKDRPWSDETPQIGITFRSKSGVFTHRFSLLGYVSAKDEDYVKAADGKDDVQSSDNHDEQYVLRNGQRVISARKTGTAQEKLAKFLGSLKTGVENAIDALALCTGMETTIVLKDVNGRIEYNYSKISMPKAVVVSSMAEGEEL
jgi:hypothetical protein